MGSEKSLASIGFVSAVEADRLIAGVAAAARAVREKVEEGAGRILLGVGGGRPSAATLADIERLRGDVSVEIVPKGDGPPGRYPLSSWEIVRRTGKPGDGLVSRWLNRPVSQRITWLVLHVRGARPIHATIATGLIAVAMFASLLAGGSSGLILGAILFHVASVIDGVDGELARATWRTSASGAALDSAVDLCTNVLFILGLTIALALRDGPLFAWAGGWSLGLAAVGMVLIGWNVRRDGAPLGFDLVKHRYAGRFAWPAVTAFVRAATIVSSRDCFAFLFMLLILAGLEREALVVFALLATLWIAFVLGAVGLRPGRVPQGGIET
jgi:1L-myo-inositol 1-phosphate cytidylyltransferase / CDP-L-myo-inositol myo-inositolphosphotransferase